MSQSTDKDTDSTMSDGAKFHECIASRWTAGYAKGGFHRRLSCFRSAFDRNVKPGQSWLDLGCGSGVLSKELLVRDASVVAVDGSPRMLKEAQENVGTEWRNPPEWIRADVQRLSQLSDGFFDGVLCSSVIEYVDSPHALLCEAGRVLRPGGRLLISVPPKWSAIRNVQKIIRRISLIFGKDMYAYLSVSRFEVAPGKLHHWLNEAGFILDRVTTFDPVLPLGIQSILRPSLMIVEAHRKLAV